MPTTLDLDPRVIAVLERLHAASDGQAGTIGAYFARRTDMGDVDRRRLDAETHRFFADKLVALDAIKAEFAYQLCRSLGAKRIVEAGTSYGVSTLYLASAVRANGGGVVIGTEYEAEKAATARRNFAEAGLADQIDLREGDLRQTLTAIDGPVDFMLMDIWTEMARPAIELVGPHLRVGAIVLADNTTQFRRAYAEYFAYINDPANRFITLTLPFEGGLEMSVRTG
jgi:predicted O-methyltransferase YrrM